MVGNITPNTRRVLEVDSIEGARGQINLIAAYRHPRPNDEKVDFHTFRFRFEFDEEGTCLLGLDEWLPPERTVSAWQVGMLKYVKAYFSHYDVRASMSVPVHEHGDYLDGPPPDRFENDAELTVS